MATEPDHLRLDVVCPPPGKGYPQVRPIVSGRDLLAEIPSGVGEGPPLVGAAPRHLVAGSVAPLRATATPHEVRLARTGCLEECCGALYVTVGRDGEHVVWTGWRNPVKESVDLPELRFSADQYEAEVRRAGADLDWEWPGETVARLLEAALREHDDWPARWDCDLDSIWSARMEPGRIEMMLTFPRGAADTDRLWLQFGLTLEISADDPSKQVEQLVARLTAGDPRTVAKVWGGSQAAAEHFGYPWPPDYP